MEIGLTEKPPVAEVHTGRSPRYSPIEIPRYQDVRETLALIDSSDLPSTLSPEPSQYMLVIGDVVTNIPLDVSTGAKTEVSLIMDAEAAEDLAERITASGQGTLAPRIETTTDGCDDLIIGYQLFGRALGGKWTKYLYGPLTLRCPSADDESSIETNRSPEQTPPPTPRTGHHDFDHGSRSGTPGMGSPQGEFSPEFMSSQGPEELASNIQFEGKSAESRITIKLRNPDSPTVAKENLRIACQDDVDDVVLHVDTTKVPKELLDEVPVQFKLTFGDNVVTTYLVPDGRAQDTNDYRMVLDSGVLQDIVMKVNNTDKFLGYDDVRIDYVLRGRRLGGVWGTYAEGLILFDCSDTSPNPDLPTSKYIMKHKFDHGAKTGNPGQGSPHGGFGPAFLADETEDDS